MTKAFTRQEFYELVWSKPMTQLAKEFAISDVALHKICKKHNIPNPPPGWWAKKAAGKDARASLLAWLERRGGTVGDYVFPSRVDHNGHLSTRQYARLVDEWVTGVGLMRSEYGTHSLRRTKASIIYRATGNLRAVQILLGHSKIENTVRYLGIDVEDALALAENTEI